VSAGLAGRVFNVQRFSLHDGPGIRTTVFLKGCPARCAWCHNPESQSFEPEVIRVETRCASCGTCETVCPHGALPPGSGLCTACGDCVEACPAGARQLVGTDRTVGDVLDEVVRDRIFFQESGGGVTFSGGEPLAQLPFLRGLLKGARAHGLHTAVDTCGFASREAVLGLAPLVDLFLFDVKLPDDARHREATGLPSDSILANLRALVDAHPAVWIRVPIVPGYTDHPIDVAAIVALVAGLSRPCPVSLLPYHATGAAKARRLGRPSSLEALAPPTPDHLETLADLFRERGLAVSIGA
jgi:pyruvate formate lyase activating enzyme